MGVDLLPVRLQQCREFLLRLAGQAGSVAHHALDHGVPFGGAAVTAQERSALLVAKAALQHELLAHRVVGQRLVQRGGPGIGRPLLGQRPDVGLGNQRQDRVGVQVRSFQRQQPEPRLSQPQAKGPRTVRQHGPALTIGKPRGLEQSLLQSAGRGIAVVRRVDGRRRVGDLRHHDQTQRLAIFGADLQRQGLCARMRQRQQQGAGGGDNDRFHLRVLAVVCQLNSPSAIGVASGRHKGAGCSAQSTRPSGPWYRAKVRAVMAPRRSAPRPRAPSGRSRTPRTRCSAACSRTRSSAAC